MDKILITGTGRCGTTFLIKLFSFLNFNTGFNKDNYKDFIFSNCNSGLEKNYNENYYILKNPRFMSEIIDILQDDSIKIKLVIIPIRDYKISAHSRQNISNFEGCGNIVPGGLWNAVDELSQIRYYKDILSDYIYYMTKYELNTIFIDFDKMISDKKYLFNKIKNILDEKNIEFDLFCNVYDEVSVLSKKNF